MSSLEEFETEEPWTEIHLEPEPPISGRAELDTRIQSLDTVSREKVLKFQKDLSTVVLEIKQSVDAGVGLVLTPEQTQVLARALALMSKAARPTEED